MKERPRRLKASRLGDVLEAQGRRQDWLAREVGVSRAQICRLIGGTRTTDEETARRIASALGVPLFLAFDFPVGNKSIPIEIEAA